jgi:predicted amidohydrolase YtcJ
VTAAGPAPIFEGPINADPALTRDDVLAAITVNAAQQLRLERQVDTIETGKFADLIHARAAAHDSARDGPRALLVWMCTVLWGPGDQRSACPVSGSCVPHHRTAAHL